MTVQEAARPDVIRRQVRPASYALTITGTIISLASLAGMSWFSVTGPNIISSSQDDAPTTRGSNVAIVSSHVGSERSWLIWLIFAVCVMSAGIAGLPKSGLPAAARVVAPTLAVLLCLDAVASAILFPHVLLNIGSSGLPSGTVVTLHAGFWLALVGFILIGLGSALGSRSTRT